MCSLVSCSTCGKTTWSGCGQHVDQIMKEVPVAQRCPGHPQSTSSGSGFFTNLFKK